MTYNQAKVLTLLSGGVATVLMNLLAAFNGRTPSTDIIIASSLIAFFPGLLLGGIAWGLVRISYVEKMLNKTTLSAQQIGRIWILSCRYSFYKDMDYQEMIGKINRLVEFSSDEIRAKEEDIREVAIACICIHYSNLWKGKWCGGHEGMNNVMKEYHDQIKMVEFFKSGK